MKEIKQIKCYGHIFELPHAIYLDEDEYKIIGNQNNDRGITYLLLKVIESIGAHPKGGEDEQTGQGL